MRFVELKDAPQGLRERARRLYDESFPPHERWSSEAFGRAAHDPAFHTLLAIGPAGTKNAGGPDDTDVSYAVGGYGSSDITDSTDSGDSEKAGSEEALFALLYYWSYGDVIYIEHLAVAPRMRGCGTGAEIVRRLVAGNPGKRILLEIDPPADEASRRRLKFYERLGFAANDYEHIHPSYVSGEKAHPHPLVLMSHGGKITPQEFARFRKFLQEILDKYGD